MAVSLFDKVNEGGQTGTVRPDFMYWSDRPGLTSTFIIEKAQLVFCPLFHWIFGQMYQAHSRNT
jgi:hypothetical protein